jgi:phage terminase large subunit GpA-like protein
MSDVGVWFAKALKPRAKRTVAEWMEQEFWLSSESSKKAGPFRFDSAPYQRGIAEAISDPDVREMVLMTSSQVGKTTVLRGLMGYYMHHAPSPMLIVVPTDKIAPSFAADFVDPMIRDTPCLKKLFKRRDGRSQTALKKTFPGGTMTIVGANVPSNLAMRPIRIVLGDEVDRWPKSAGKEGSPIKLATARTITFESTKKLVWVSTPTLEETSVIAEMFERSDKRYFFVKCPTCETEQHLKWEQVVYTKGKEEEAEYACENCGSLWSEMLKRRLVREGRWVATNPGAELVGFHISALYSPWSSLSKMAKKRETARISPADEQTFWNTELGLPWSGAMSARASASSLVDRAESIQRGRLAPKCALLTAGVDIQRDRIEIMVWGWGPDEESWIVDHHIEYGDPAGVSIWAKVEEWLLRRYPHPLGVALAVEAIAVDSGDGVHTEAVYNWTGKMQQLGREWLAIKGVQMGPLWARSKQKFSNRPNFKFYIIGTNDGKNNLYSRIGVEIPGPSYIHVPEWFAELNDGRTIQQMTAEWGETEWDDNGFPHVVWKKKQGDRNEALDMSVYAYAVMKHLDLDLRRRLLSWASPEADLDPAAVGSLYA